MIPVLFCLESSCNLLGGYQDLGENNTYTLNKETVFSSETSIAICKATHHAYLHDSSMAAFSTKNTRVDAAYFVIHFKV
jgi:hypothetical protein